MAKITNVQIDLLKAFVNRFDLDIVNDGQSISFENAVRIFQGEQPIPKTKDERRKDFIGSLSPYLQTYGSKMLNDFYRYWAKDDGAKMKFENQKSWNVELRLSKWKSNQDEYERNNYIKQLSNVFRG
ncbi:MAG: hypothetical protein ACK5XN_38830 [Bacteroidota bacterium]